MIFHSLIKRLVVSVSLVWLQQVPCVKSLTTGASRTSQALLTKPLSTQAARFLHQLTVSQCTMDRQKSTPAKQCTMGNQESSDSDVHDIGQLNERQSIDSRMFPATIDPIKTERLLAVEGSHTGKTNDVVHYGPDHRGSPHANHGHVVFFGGDVQDFTEKMMAHRDNKRYVEWNVESTAGILADRFPNHHIWVIKPSKMHLNTFSVYANFVESDGIGCPKHSQGQDSWAQVHCLLQNGLKQSFFSHSPGGPTDEKSHSQEGDTEEKTDLCSKQHHEESGGKSEGTQTHTPEGSGDEQHHSPEGHSSHSPGGHTSFPSHSPDGASISEDSQPVILVGFSKGCVVLNQLLYDLPSAKADTNLWEFVRRVTTMYWLDGGHNGGSNTWITSESILEALVCSDIEVIAHVTPYQVKDPMRKWIGKEQKKFIHNLRKLGVNVSNSQHFAAEDRSLENHFAILKEF